jgi:disulfide oxidoreductase YuzD
MEERKEKEYRVYVTDILLSILKAQFTERIDIPRYIDIINPPKEKKLDRTADEIIQDISHKLDMLGK